MPKHIGLRRGVGVLLDRETIYLSRSGRLFRLPVDSYEQILRGVGSEIADVDEIFDYLFEYYDSAEQAAESMVAMTVKRYGD